MTSCLAVTFTPAGGDLSAEIVRQGGRLRPSFREAGGLTASGHRVGGLAARVERPEGLTARMWLACEPNLRKPYLEISPEVVWMLAGWASNDVFSNTNWNVI